MDKRWCVMEKKTSVRRTWKKGEMGRLERDYGSFHKFWVDMNSKGMEKEIVGTIIFSVNTRKITRRKWTQQRYHYNTENSRVWWVHDVRSNEPLINGWKETQTKDKVIKSEKSRGKEQRRAKKSRDGTVFFLFVRAAPKLKCSFVSIVCQGLNWGS